MLHLQPGGVRSCGPPEICSWVCLGFYGSCRRSGTLSTNAEVLVALQDQHPLPAIVMQHRKMKKLLSDFVDTLVDRAIQQQQQQQQQQQGNRKQPLQQQSKRQQDVLDSQQPSLWTWIRQLRLQDLAGPAGGKPRRVARYWQQHHKKGKQKQHM